MRDKPKKVDGFVWRDHLFPDFNTYCTFNSDYAHGRSYCKELMCEVWVEEVKPEIFLYQALSRLDDDYGLRTVWRDSPTAAMDELCERMRFREKIKAILLEEK